MDRANRNRAGRWGVAAVLIVLLMSAVACGSSGGTAGSTTGGRASTTSAGGSSGFDPASYKAVKTTINGSGSTFQQNFDSASIKALSAVLPGIKITYGGGGSGQGKSDLAHKSVDFAGTDSTFKPDEKAALKGAKVLFFPTVVAPITVSYNLDVKGLKLDGPTLAQIFSANITKWDDPAIAKLNRGKALPGTAITVCHRADASGTTSNFTKFLTAAGGADWKLGQSDSINWPSGTQGAQGNGGVAQCVNGKQGAIGYVDFADAKAQGLTFAAVKNAAGQFVAASLDGASKAAAESKVAADLTYDPINAPGAGSYPITSPTWIIVYAQQPNNAKAQALRAFLQFMLTDGQQLARSSDYAPLPKSLAERALRQLETLR